MFVWPGLVSNHFSRPMGDECNFLSFPVIFSISFIFSNIYIFIFLDTGNFNV
jgi:hypothetical protein